MRVHPPHILTLYPQEPSRNTPALQGMQIPIYDHAAMLLFIAPTPHTAKEKQTHGTVFHVDAASQSQNVASDIPSYVPHSAQRIR